MYQNNAKRVTTGKKKNRKIQFLLLALILLLTIVGILGAVYLLSGYNSRNTFEYQYNSSVKAYENGEYDKALNYIDRALELEDEEENIKLAVQLKYSIYIAKKDYNGAITILLQMIEEEPTAQRYTSLLELYSRTGNYGQIEELGNKLVGTEYYEIYKNYMVGSISASMDDGVFSSGILVELSASKPDLVIHYTIDGTKPTVESDIYNGVIKFSSEGTHTLRAVGVNAQGILSEEILRTYIINVEDIGAPSVYPETGEYRGSIEIEMIEHAENSRIYYTLDGSVPTTESLEYTDIITLKCGNYVLGAVVAMDVEGENGTEVMYSDVVWRVYSAAPNYPYTYQAAIFKIKNKLVTDGVMSDMDGNTTEGSIIKVNFIDFGLMGADGMITLEDALESGNALGAEEKRYYVFNITSEYNGLVEQFDGYYCVSVDDGTLLEVNSVNE